MGGGGNYVLKIDIEKFYPSISNDILKSLLRNKFKDNKLLNLLDIIIDSTQGLPLGSYTSQWLGNFYLNGLDHYIKEDLKVRRYIRYCDDVVIIAETKEELHFIRERIQEYLGILELKLGKYQVFPINLGIDFLGYKSYKSHIEIRKSIKLRYVRMMKKYPNSKSIASYNGWLAWCDSKNLRRKYK